MSTKNTSKNPYNKVIRHYLFAINSHGVLVRAGEHLRQNSIRNCHISDYGYSNKYDAIDAANDSGCNLFIVERIEREYHNEP